MFWPMGFIAFISCTMLLSIQSCDGSEIIGGKEVRPHSMPFMALLENRTSGEQECGGTLIDPSWVLTAAHCGELGKVLLGVHSIKSEKEKKFRQVRMVKEYFPHRSYDNGSKMHDLMLLKLDKPAVQTKTVNWLELGNTVQDPKAGTICVVAGWGKKTNIAQQMSDVLMSVRVTVVDREKCNYSYNHRPVITDSMVCAGSAGKHKADTCQGDSGGPLLCGNTLVGVTSFGGRKCGDVKFPGVYTFMPAQHLKWIKRTMNP